MYKAFYNLSRNPFDISPDPAFLFATPKHNEALAALYHAVRGHKGFVVLTGEVGTGKTLLLRCVLELFRESSDIGYAYVFNGLLSPCEFLEYIATDFGLSVAGKNKSQILFDLSNFLVARGSKNLTTVLVVDEAHHLSADILEEIRLLTNLETAGGKLLQILLVGQPELDDKLDSPTLRQLKQRIAHRAHLAPLDVTEAQGYIDWRLQIAGAKPGNALFPQDTIASVYRHSKGIPRLINTICDNALITAYARKLQSVSPEIVDSTAADLRLHVVHLRPIHELRTAADAKRNQEQRARLLELAGALEAGRVRHRFQARTALLNTLRLEAVHELRTQAALPGPTNELPGPNMSEWLTWAFNLHDEKDATGIAQLRAHFAVVERFAAEMEESYWFPGQRLHQDSHASAVPPVRTEPVAPSSDELITAVSVAQHTQSDNVRDRVAGTKQEGANGSGASIGPRRAPECPVERSQSTGRADRCGAGFRRDLRAMSLENPA